MLTRVWPFRISLVEPGPGHRRPRHGDDLRVGTVKDLPGLRTYVSVDGGMSDNIRPALYGAHYTVALASRRSEAPAHIVTVVGKHCESGDLVAPNVTMPADVRPGDLLALASSGAYHRSMASNYNHVPRPPVVAVRDGALESSDPPRNRSRPPRPGPRMSGDPGNAGQAAAGCPARLRRRRQRGGPPARSAQGRARGPGGRPARARRYRGTPAAAHPQSSCGCSDFHR